MRHVRILHLRFIKSKSCKTRNESQEVARKSREKPFIQGENL